MVSVVTVATVHKDYKKVGRNIMLEVTKTYEIDTIDDLYRMCWSYAIDTLNAINNSGREKELMQLLEDVFCDSNPTDGDINDFLWFDRLYIYAHLRMTVDGKAQETAVQAALDIKDFEKLWGYYYDLDNYHSTYDCDVEHMLNIMGEIAGNGLEYKFMTYLRSKYYGDSIDLIGLSEEFDGMDFDDVIDEVYKVELQRVLDRKDLSRLEDCIEDSDGVSVLYRASRYDKSKEVMEILRKEFYGKNCTYDDVASYLEMNAYEIYKKLDIEIDEY